VAPQAARQQGTERRLDPRWRVTYQTPDTFTVQLAEGLRYTVSPLTAENTP